ncbi:unnamed protein product [Heterobilharzia americana]|nr:unnamed protein product [Heterobilharzia americana]
MSYIQSDSTNVSNNLSISNQSNSNFIEFQNNNPSNKESLEFPTDCTIKESIFLKSDSNENLINKLGDNSCKHYFRPAD